MQPINAAFHNRVKNNRSNIDIDTTYDENEHDDVIADDDANYNNAEEEFEKYSDLRSNN